MALNSCGGENDLQANSVIAKDPRTSLSPSQGEPGEEMIETESTVELSLQQKELADVKMQPITKKTPIEKNCAEGELSHEEIKHEDGSHAEETMQSSKVKFCLNFSSTIREQHRKSDHAVAFILVHPDLCYAHL